MDAGLEDSKNDKPGISRGLHRFLTLMCFDSDLF